MRGYCKDMAQKTYPKRTTRNKSAAIAIPPVPSDLSILSASARVGASRVLSMLAVLTS